MASSGCAARASSLALQLNSAGHRPVCNEKLRPSRKLSGKNATGGDLNLGLVFTVNGMEVRRGVVPIV